MIRFVILLVWPAPKDINTWGLGSTDSASQSITMKSLPMARVVVCLVKELVDGY